jgi:regulation of enolase protein 1 (concanavalin A-like superfamily)
VSRISGSFLALAIVSASVSHAFSQDSRRQVLKGWGEAVDPDRDCKIGLDGERMTIVVPGKTHDLSIETGGMNAPRVLRNVTGDFVAQVKVAGKVRHTGDRASQNSLAYHGAGLLLWQDEQTYIRLERAALVTQNGGNVHYANFELRKAGNLVRVEKPAFRIPDHDTYLRIERRGDRVFGSASEDGVRWLSFEPYVVDLPGALKIGVAAVSSSTEPLKAEFVEFEVFTKNSNP